MKKLNNEGFALTEILIVSAFVAVTFTLLYTNVIPLMGAYESYENYDTIDTKYTAYYMRKFLSGGYINKDGLIGYKNKLITKDTCNDTNIFNNKAMCRFYFTNLRIDSMYFSTFNTQEMKKIVINDNTFATYINYLPNYTIEDGYGAKQGLYRIIIKMHNNDIKTFYYGTIEVDL